MTVSRKLGTYQLPGFLISDCTGPQGNQQAGNHPNQLIQQHIYRGQQRCAADKAQSCHDQKTQNAARHVNGQTQIPGCAQSADSGDGISRGSKAVLGSQSQHRILRSGLLSGQLRPFLPAGEYQPPGIDAEFFLQEGAGQHEILCQNHTADLLVTVQGA